MNQAWILLTLALPAWASCAHAGAGPEDAALPAGCRINLSGSWEHEDNVGFRYELEDDGQVLKMLPSRVNADGTPAEPGPKNGEIHIELRRGIGGFTGDFRMVQVTDNGQPCPVLFQARVTECAPDRLTLQIEQSYAVNGSCQRIDMGANEMVEHVLVRRRPSPDAAR